MGSPKEKQRFAPVTYGGAPEIRLKRRCATSSLLGRGGPLCHSPMLIERKRPEHVNNSRRNTIQPSRIQLVPAPDPSGPNATSDNRSGNRRISWRDREIRSARNWMKEMWPGILMRIRYDLLPLFPTCVFSLSPVLPLKWTFPAS